MIDCRTSESKLITSLMLQRRRRLMKFNPRALPITSKALFTIVGGAVLINPVFAQEQQGDQLEEVVVTGIRGSLQASMDIKRNASGVVDAISSEDIGKF